MDSGLVQASPSGHSRWRRWYLWVGIAVLAAVATGGTWLWLGSGHAKPVSIQQAEQRLKNAGTSPGLSSVPAQGVYVYSGSGKESLTVPPRSQAEGPQMPGTVTVDSGGCWTFRIDYSTRHWQSWNYCSTGGTIVKTGGQVWELWQIGPLHLTNLTTLTCSPPASVVPATVTPGQKWTSRCTGTSNQVKGALVADESYRYVGQTAVPVGAARVQAQHFLLTTVDSGAQQGAEQYECWIATSTGLPLRIQQNIKVTTDTPVGRSTYMQSGVFSLADINPHH